METGEEYFTDAVEEAKKIEKRALKYKAYDGPVNIRHDIDLYPSDYVDIDYRDLINVYDRAQKIKKASKMKIYTAPGAAGEKVKEPTPEKKPISEIDAKKISEVESRLKNITSEALKKAEEIAASGKADKETLPEAKPVVHPEIEFERELKKEEEHPEELEIEFEKPIEFEEPEKKEIGIEKPPPSPPEPIELEREGPSIVEKIEEPPVPKKIKEPEEEKPIAEEAEVLMPKILESPDEAAEKKFKQIEDEVKSTMGKKVDEKEIKKKMLELTKQLFKEKSMDRREEIKHEIAALKNMLSAKKEPGARKAAAKAKGGKKAPKEEAAKLQVFQTLISTQESEIAQTKDEITSSFRHKIDDLKTRFYDDLSVAETPDEKKKLYDRLVFELTKLSEQLPGTIGKFKEYNVKKNLAELRRMKESLGPKDKEVRGQVDERITNIESKYAEIFGVLHDLLSKRIEGVVRTASKDVFEKKPEEERTVVEKEEAKVDEVISEISNLDPGTLLYYLHSKEPDYYKMYERKRVSKAEALSRSRVLMAKEKGLTDDLISKYFGTVED